MKYQINNNYYIVTNIKRLTYMLLSVVFVTTKKNQCNIMKKIRFIPLSDNDILKQDINRLKNKKKYKQYSNKVHKNLN